MGVSFNYFEWIFEYTFSMAPHSVVTQGLLIVESSRSHTHTTQQDSSGRVISQSQRPLPDNTQHSQNRHPCPPAGIELVIPASERPHTHVLDRAAAAMICIHQRFNPQATNVIYIYIYIYMERIFLMFLDHTRRTTVGRTPLDE